MSAVSCQEAVPQAEQEENTQTEIEAVQPSGRIAVIKPDIRLFLPVEAAISDIGDMYPEVTIEVISVADFSAVFRAVGVAADSYDAIIYPNSDISGLKNKLKINNVFVVSYYLDTSGSIADAFCGQNEFLDGQKIAAEIPKTGKYAIFGDGGATADSMREMISANGKPGYAGLFLPGEESDAYRITQDLITVNEEISAIAAFSGGESAAEAVQESGANVKIIIIGEDSTPFPGAVKFFPDIYAQTVAAVEVTSDLLLGKSVPKQRFFELNRVF